MNATQRIMDYLNEVAKQDNALADHLKNEKLKTPSKMMIYISGEAKKEAEKTDDKSSICIDDDTVFQWARHYWLDYEEKEVKEKPIQAKVVSTDSKDKKTTTTAKKEVVKEAPQKPTKQVEQISLFDDLFN